MATKLGKIHIMTDNGKTMLCGREFVFNSSSSCVALANKSAIKSYIQGKYPRQCKTCIEVLRQHPDYLNP
jgi:hypothetical protein